MAFAMVALCATPAKADSKLKNLLSGLGDVAKETISQTTSKSLTVEDLEGTWKVSSPAVSFKSDNLLQQAGGAAVTSSIEKKLKKYYKSLGLLSGTMTIQSDGSFVMKLKNIPISGTLTKASDGTFKMQLLSKLASLSSKDRSMTVYITKSGNEMSLTMDAKKLIKIFTAVASKAGSSTLSSVTSLLESYDEICIGYRYKK